MQIFKRVSGSAAVLAVLALSAPVWAQTEIRTVMHVRLKPDKGGDFVAAVKELVALETKGGAERGFTIWQALTGPREYVVVSYASKWAELDQTADPKMKAHEGAMAAITARLQACSESLETEIHTMVPELVSPPGKAPPALVRTGRTTVAPGKMDEVLNVFRSELVPAWKKAGVAAYGVYRVRFGAPANQIHTFSALNGWADLDGPSPAAKGLGAEAYSQFMARMGALTLRTEYTIYRFRPELSYMPAAK